jgi:COP9 signalosome complex subunit 4
MHFLRLLSPTEVTSFSLGLKPHQTALLPDVTQQTTVLSNAVLEHNLAAASQVYENITFEALGGLLGVGEGEAERYAATMIEQGRMGGWIDQPEGVIWFEGEGGEVRRWDEGIKELCAHVEEVASLIQVMG